VIVWPFTKILNAGLVPTPDDQDGWNCYWFYVSGLGFVLHYGDAVPAEIKRRCAQNTPQRVITVEHTFGDVVWELVRAEVRDGDTPELQAMLEEIKQVKAKENSPTPPSLAPSDPSTPSGGATRKE